MASHDSLSTAPGIPLTPPAKQATLPSQTSETTAPPSSFKSTDSAANPAASQSPPLNPLALNNAPAPIPIPTSPAAAATTSPAPAATLDPTNPGATLPGITPTVAETGVPVSAGDKGPGPASGSLHDIKAASPSAGPKSGGLAGNVPSDVGFGQTLAATPAKFESAEEEKKRLQREDRERLLAAQGPVVAAPTSNPAHESAEDEKKRLEREERERVLRGNTGTSGGNNADGPGPKKDDGDDLPAYQEM